MYNGASGGEPSYSLRDIFQAVVKRLWIVALVTILCVGVAVGYSLWQTPVYQATAKMLVGQEQLTSDQQSGNVDDLQQVTLTMIGVIQTRPVAEEVIQQQNLQTTPDSFLGHLTAVQEGSTQVIELGYTDPDPQRAQEVANAVGEVASGRISDVSAGVSGVTGTVIQPAIIPDTPVSPDPARNGLLALGLGLMLGVGLALLLEYLDDSWRSPEEVEQVSGVPTFGVIPEFKLAESKR